MHLSSGFMKYKCSYLKRIESRSAPLRDNQTAHFELPTHNTTNISMRCFTHYGTMRPLVFEWKDGLRMWCRDAD